MKFRQMSSKWSLLEIGLLVAGVIMMGWTDLMYAQDQPESTHPRRQINRSFAAKTFMVAAASSIMWPKPSSPFWIGECFHI